MYDLIARVFHEFVAPDYSHEGIREFLKYAEPAALQERSKANHFVLLAVSQDILAGVIEVRNNDHISLLFVGRDYQRQGVSRDLLHMALKTCHNHKPELSAVTVNSSPFAVSIYEKLGFHATGPEQVVHGIRFTPMALDLSKGG